MTKTEKLIPLTPRDIEKLKGRKSGGAGCFLIVAIVIIGTTALLYFLANDIYGGSFNFDGLPVLPVGVVVLPFGLAFIVLAYFIMRRYAGKANKDITEGTKKVVTAQVLKKFTENLDPSNRTNFAIKTAYMVDIDGIAYDVKEEEYQKYEVGMWVEVHKGSYSSEFLGIYDHSNGKLLTEELL